MNSSDHHHYIVGAGIAGLSVAAYLIRDADISGDDITILDAAPTTGGGLDAAINPEHAYIMRGFRMFEETVYSATMDLMSFIPTASNSTTTLLQDFQDFNTTVHTYAKARLIHNKRIINSHPLKLTLSDRLRLLKLLLTSERYYHKQRIDEYFSKQFFKSSFWYEYATTFSFQPWHGVAEFRRYFLRFLQDAPVLDTDECISSTRYNQYDSLITPLSEWLEERGVIFSTDTIVTNVLFSDENNGSTAHTIQVANQDDIELHETDNLFITLGSMVADTRFGTHTSAPAVTSNSTTPPAWHLWETIAKHATGTSRFGNPAIFNQHTNQSHWVGFTATFNQPYFFDAMEQFSGNTDGTDGVVTITDSNWLLSYSLPKQPHFKNQPAELQVAWGYGLYPDAPGNFIKKPMTACTGKEILQELLFHLPFADEADAILESTTVIPNLMPYITSQFFPHAPGDRPAVIPPGASNYALIGQFVEIPEDIVFTVEYSIRSAQIAVHELLNTSTPPSPIYHGNHSLKVWWNAVLTAFR